jgi:catechol 2,3-dioxygenase-like lactoylglutathione lyase family enzyme
MSYVALATDSFDAVARFYGEDLGFAVAEEWDRANGRGRRFDLHGLRQEAQRDDDGDEQDELGGQDAGEVGLDGGGAAGPPGWAGEAGWRRL